MDDVYSESWELDRIVDMNGVEPFKDVTLVRTVQVPGF